MQYVLLIHAAESRYTAMSPEQNEQLMQAYGAFSQELFATGRAGDAAALELSHTATCVRVREGKRSVKDGPFAETREQLGGYYTLRAESEAEAIDWAARIPDAPHGTIEVRPIPELNLPPYKEGTKLDPKALKEYLLLIYEDENVQKTMSEVELQQMYGKYIAFTQGIVTSGHYIAGAPLDRA
jgi:hypothetical protein